jgi:hypothetical protein
VDGARVLLRSNAVDCKLLTEVFGGVYALPASHSPKRILDLGANIGLSALYFHRQYPEASIACVEPAPKNFSMLSRIISLNALPVTLFDCAIGPEAGSTALYDTANPRCCTLVADAERVENQIPVQQKTVRRSWLYCTGTTSICLRSTSKDTSVFCCVTMQAGSRGYRVLLAKVMMDTTLRI